MLIWNKRVKYGYKFIKDIRLFFLLLFSRSIDEKKTIMLQKGYFYIIKAFG